MAAEGREMKTDDPRQRPVQFRGLSTHYVAGEDIRVAFRYPTSSFLPHSEDKVKLYASRARERSVASASVGDTAQHRLCDGGLYKTGSVTMTTGQLSGRRPASYVLLYGSSRLRSVVGKSEPFIICPQENFPSIQIRTPEDSAFIEKLRSHSPLGGADDGEHSFSLVSGGLSGEWEVLEEEEEDSSGSEAWSDIGGDLKSGEESSAESEPHSGNGGVGGRFGVDPRKGREDAEIAQTPKVVTFSEAVTPPPEHQVVECGSEHPLENEGLGMFKSANRELRTKVRVLHDKLHSACRERDCLQETLENMSTQLSSLQLEKSKLKYKNKKLAEEKHGLKAKNKDLMRENAVLTQHCQRQVAQMGAYEAQLKTLSGEQLWRKTRASPQSAHQKEAPTTSDPVATSANTQIGSVWQKPVIDVFVRDSDKTGDKKSQRAAKKRNRTGKNWS